MGVSPISKKAGEGSITQEMITEISTKNERERLKNHAVELREARRYEEAVAMFESILAWDEQNSNVRGYADVCGHLSIAWRKWADILGDPADPEKKEEIINYKHKALEYCQKGIDYIHRHLEVENTERTLSNLHVHMSMAYYDLALIMEGDYEQKMNHLNKAWDAIQEAERLFMLGAQTQDAYERDRAALGWLIKDKAKIIFEIGITEGNEQGKQKTEQAWGLLSQALTNVNAGAAEEIEKSDQARLKLSAWVHGILLTYAYFHYRLGNNPMAKMYCEMVKNSPKASEIRREEAVSLSEKLPR